MKKNIIKNILFLRHNLKVGDLIWAKRYNNEEEKEKIKKGHQESPHVVIKKTLTKIYVLTCTSNPHTEIDWKFKYYPLNRITYNLNKNTYVYLEQLNILTKNQFIKKLGHLNNYDLTTIKKYLSIEKPTNILKSKDLKYTYDVGDVILYKNQKYYIYEVNKKEYLTYHINKKINNQNKILVNNSYYTFDFNNQLKIPKKNKIKLIDTFNTGEIEFIIKYKINNNQPKETKEINIGSLILYKNRFFYVANILDGQYEIYSICINEKITKNKGIFLIAGGYYFTYFQKQVINKTDNIIVRRQASNEEIKINQITINLTKEQRINEKNKLLKKINQEKLDNFFPMSIITHKVTKKNYLIISREKNILELININDFGDYFYYLLEENNCPYKFFRIISTYEYEEYLQKVNELKSIYQLIKK